MSRYRIITGCSSFDPNYKFKIYVSSNSKLDRLNLDDNESNNRSLRRYQLKFLNSIKRMWYGQWDNCERILGSYNCKELSIDDQKTLIYSRPYHIFDLINPDKSVIRIALKSFIACVTSEAEFGTKIWFRDDTYWMNWRNDWNKEYNLAVRHKAYPNELNKAKREYFMKILFQFMNMIKKYHSNFKDEIEILDDIKNELSASVLMDIANS